jgi:hypothetical protein
MLKFLSFISFTLIYLSASAQKVSSYFDKTIDFNKYNYFFMANCPINIHNLTSPYIDKKNLKGNEIGYFILYNELSLKNLVIIDDHAEIGTLQIYLYEGSSFDASISTPVGYKPKKLTRPHFIIDMIDGGSKTLVWRGWIDLSKIKSSGPYQHYQKGITAILNNFHIQPVIAD